MPGPGLRTPTPHARSRLSVFTTLGCVRHSVPGPHVCQAPRPDDMLRAKSDSCASRRCWAQVAVYTEAALPAGACACASPAPGAPGPGRHPTRGCACPHGPSDTSLVCFSSQLTSEETRAQRSRRLLGWAGPRAGTLSGPQVWPGPTPRPPPRTLVARGMRTELSGSAEVRRNNFSSAWASGAPLAASIPAGVAEGHGHGLITVRDPRSTGMGAERTAAQRS